MKPGAECDRHASTRHRTCAALVVFTLAACSESSAPAPVAPSKNTAAVRAERRLYDGAPPTIPHAPVGAACTTCHGERGIDVPGVGFAPPSPHEQTPGMSALVRCEQCHVYQTTDAVFRESSFAGLRQDLRRGTRLYAGAPPVIPHLVQMRENCRACHDGVAAREEVRCTHPDRARCTQCHVQQTTTAEFARRD